MVIVRENQFDSRVVFCIKLLIIFNNVEIQEKDHIKIIRVINTVNINRYNLVKNQIYVDLNNLIKDKNYIKDMSASVKILNR